MGFTSFPFQIGIAQRALPQEKNALARIFIPRRFIFITILVVLIIAICVSVVTAIVNFRKVGNGNIASTNPAAGQRQFPSRISVTRITVQPWGFEPSEITVPKGPLYLALENQSDSRVLNWSLSRENGAKVKESELPRKKKHHKEVFNLPPGNYVLTEANQPDWICRITVDNK
jgi:hypothetical protein